MIALSKLLSLRNGLRLSGLIVLSIGAPIAACPALGVLIFLGKRENSDADKRALQLTVRSNGIAAASTGLACILAKPTPGPLVASTLMHAIYLILHLGYRFSGEWERANARKNMNTVASGISCFALLTQGYALGWGDREEDE